MAGIILGWKVYHKVREHLFRGEWVDHKTAVQHWEKKFPDKNSRRS